MEFEAREALQNILQSTRNVFYIKQKSDLNLESRRNL